MNLNQTVFDRAKYEHINQAREPFLRSCLASLPFRDQISTALDVGCGAGYFSGVMRDLGFSVTGIDLRPENIEICRERYPDLNFSQVDLDQDFSDLGCYDVVLMFGILYHLVSPLQTILRLSKSIGRIGIVSTRVAAGNELALYLFKEKKGAASNLAPISAVPTFPALVTIFGTAGLEHIYLPREQPKHPQWRPSFGNGRRYSFVVSSEAIEIPNWDPIKVSPGLTKWEPINLGQKLLIRSGIKALLGKNS